MKFPGKVIWVVAGAALLACAGLGGDKPGRCKVKVLGVEDWNLRTGALDASYTVSGEAGSPAVVWLSAKVGESRYISGGGVDVGPGPFQAIVGLKLTGVPREFVAVLEVKDPTRATPPRCRAKAKIPG
jgi:hypothetical protein